MYERAGYQSLPFPLCEVSAPSAHISPRTLRATVQTLIEHAHGLAGVCSTASLSPETAQQDLSQALFVLKEYLEVTVGLFERWEQERRGVPPTPRAAGAGTDHTSAPDGSPLRAEVRALAASLTTDVRRELATLFRGLAGIIQEPPRPTGTAGAP